MNKQGEPVAWIYEQGAAKAVSMNYVAGVRATPLYTTPQQRTWVGLTAEEREQVQSECYGKVPHHVALIAAVEAKLMEKNHG